MTGIAMSTLDYRRLGPCLFAIALDAMGFGLVYPMMSALFGDPHSSLVSADAAPAWRNFCLGLGYGIYPFFMFFGSSLMGALSDAFGRRRILLLCLLGLSASYFMMALGATLPSLALLLAGRGLSGLMAGCQGIAQAAIVDVSAPAHKARNMSVMSIAFSAGVIVGPVLGGIASDATLAPWLGYGTPFAAVGVLALGCAWWTWIAYRDVGAGTVAARVDLLLPLRIIVEAAQDRAVAFLSGVFFLMQVGYGLYLQTIMQLLQTRFHYTSHELGLFSGMIGVCFVIGLRVVVRGMLRVGSVVDIARVGLLIAGAAQIGAALAPDAWPQWVLGAIVGCFDMVAYTTMYTAFSDAVPDARQGWALGVAGSVMAVAWVVTGALNNALPVLGEAGLLMVGGVSFIVSFGLMSLYGRWRQQLVQAA
jgi:MFS transporter, DHA1 family, tetracycline resistance protein